MSYNNNKINGLEPTTSGAFSVGLADLSDISGSFSDGDFVAYQSSTSTFVPASVASGAVALFGQGGSDAYSNSGLTITAGGTWGFYDSAPITCPGVTFNLQGATNWLSSITLGAGKWLIEAQTAAVFSGTGYLAVNIYSGATVVGSTGVIGASLTTYAGNSTLTKTSLSVASSTTVRFNIQGLLNVASASSQGNTPSEGGWVLVQRLS